MVSNTLPPEDDLPKWSAMAVRNEFADFKRTLSEDGVVAITQEGEIEIVAMDVAIYRKIAALAKTSV